MPGKSGSGGSAELSVRGDPEWRVSPGCAGPRPRSRLKHAVVEG